MAAGFQRGMLAATLDSRFQTASGRSDDLGDSLSLSVVLPCHDEEGNLAALTGELLAVLDGLVERGELDGGVEVVLVDDGSHDGTAEVLAALSEGDPRVIVLRHAERAGQSAALCSGFAVARGVLVASMDADGQADPADLPKLLAALRETGADLVCGVRQRRVDAGTKRLASRIGNGVRRKLTADVTTDAGCTYRLARREVLEELPVFDGLHRWLPALVRLAGGQVVEVPVAHRPRGSGASKYGVRDRAWRGLLDCLAMRWWERRAVPDVLEARRSRGVDAAVLFGLLLVATLVALLGPFSAWFDEAGLTRWRDFSRSHGALAGVVFTVLCAGGVALGVPRLVFAVAAGSLFPPGGAVAVALGGTLLGCLVGFGVARRFGRPWAESAVRPAVRDMTRLARRHGTMTTLLLRLLPIGNCQFTNVLLGTCGVGAREFVVGTAVGILPSTLVAVLSGTALMAGDVGAMWTAGLVFCGSLALVSLFARRHPAARAWAKRRAARATSRASYATVTSQESAAE